MKKLILVLLLFPLVAISQNTKFGVIDYLQPKDTSTIGKIATKYWILQNYEPKLLSGGIEWTDTINKIATKYNLDTLRVGMVQPVDSILFDRNAVVTATQGKLWWNNDDGTLNLGMGYDNVIQQMGLEQFIRIKNHSGVQINNGDLVMATGSLGASSIIKGAKAVSDGTVLPRYIIGVATMNIPSGSDGYVTTFGAVRGLDTDGSVSGESWVDGQVLYAHPTIVGGLTKIRPSAPYPVVICAMVLHSANSNGSIFVRLSHGESVESLNDVDTLGGVRNLGVLYYDSLKGTWRDTVLPVAAAQWTTIGNDIINTNSGNVGIGASVPQHKLTVVGSKATNNSMFNLVASDWNKNRSTEAQASDTSSFMVDITDGGKPTLTMKNNTGGTILNIDSTGIPYTSTFVKAIVIDTVTGKLHRRTMMLPANPIFTGNVTMPSTTYFYLGNATTDGSWRFYVSSTALVFERRVSGTWTEKGRFEN